MRRIMLIVAVAVVVSALWVAPAQAEKKCKNAADPVQCCKKTKELNPRENKCEKRNASPAA